MKMDKNGGAKRRHFYPSLPLQPLSLRLKILSEAKYLREKSPSIAENVTLCHCTMMQPVGKLVTEYNKQIRPFSWEVRHSTPQPSRPYTPLAPAILRSQVLTYLLG
jgi:hypothetical protein